MEQIAFTMHLFAVLRRTNGHRMDALPEAEVMRLWWQFMADLMVVQPDLAPVQRALRPVFHMD